MLIMGLLVYARLLFVYSMDLILSIADVYRGGWEDAEDLDPLPGDIIDFNRTAFTHHGIYIGNGDVVHKSGKSALATASIILRESLKSRFTMFLAWHEHTAVIFDLYYCNVTVMECGTCQWSLCPYGSRFIRFNCGLSLSTYFRFNSLLLGQAHDGSHEVTHKYMGKCVP